MAEDTSIVIKLDEKVIQQQIRDAIHKEFSEFATRLRIAADQLDGFEFLKDRDNWFKNSLEEEYQRGLRDGQGIIPGVKDIVVQ